MLPIDKSRGRVYTGNVTRANLLTAILVASARFAAAQYAPPVIEELQPPSGQSVMIPDIADRQLLKLEAAVSRSGAQLAQKKLAQVATPVDEARQFEKDYALDPANKDLAGELQARVKLFTAKTSGKPAAERRFLLVGSGPDARRRAPVPTIDCEAAEDRGVRVVGGRYLAAATDKGVLYTDLSRPAAEGAGGCLSFEPVGVVRYGATAALQGVKSLDVLPDALREAGLTEATGQAATGTAAKLLWSKPQYEIYGNKDKLVATYSTSDGGELKKFWP